MRIILIFFCLWMSEIFLSHPAYSGDIPKPWVKFSSGNSFSAYYDPTTVRKNNGFIDVKVLEVNESKGMGTTKEVRFQLSTGYCAYGHVLTYKGSGSNVIFESDFARNGYAFALPAPYEKRLLFRLKNGSLIRYPASKNFSDLTPSRNS